MCCCYLPEPRLHTEAIHPHSGPCSGERLYNVNTAMCYKTYQCWQNICVFTLFSLGLDTHYAGSAGRLMSCLTQRGWRAFSYLSLSYLCCHLHVDRFKLSLNVAQWHGLFYPVYLHPDLDAEMTSYCNRSAHYVLLSVGWLSSSVLVFLCGFFFFFMILAANKFPCKGQ